MEIKGLTVQELSLIKSGLELNSKNLERLRDACQDSELNAIFSNRRNLNRKLYKEISDAILELTEENE